MACLTEQEPEGLRQHRGHELLCKWRKLLYYTSRVEAQNAVRILDASFLLPNACDGLFVVNCITVCEPHALVRGMYARGLRNKYGVESLTE